jgi:hypothetical protein
MKHNQIVSLIRPEFTGSAVNHRVNVWWLAVRRIAVCALVTQCLSMARAADVVPVKEPGIQATLAQKPAYTPKGCQMERYKAFARQTEMPAIMITNKTTLEVGGTVKADLNRLAQLSIQEKEALAGPFGVPAGVIGRVAERAANNPPPNAEQLAQDIRTAVVDYRFLQGEWKRYNPPPEGQKTKADALQALQTGDISRAWELYDGLQKPAAPPRPVTLRVVAQ